MARKLLTLLCLHKVPSKTLRDIISNSLHTKLYNKVIYDFGVETLTYYLPLLKSCWFFVKQIIK